MINFKWGFIFAGVSSIISIGIGLFFGVSAFHIIIRAFIFAAVFFGFGFGLRFLINSFFPDLLYVGVESGKSNYYENLHGSHVNITLDTKGEYAVPELFKSSGDPDELGNIEELVSGYFKSGSEGVDRLREEGYNDETDFPSFPEAEDSNPQEMSDYEKPEAAKPAFNVSFGDGSEGLGGLPDLDAMIMAFSPSGIHSTTDFNAGTTRGNVSEAVSFDNMGLDEKKSSYIGNKPQSLKGDFNPKELAEGIRTVLAKEK